jgi:methylated-DNA-protein-cysteine methyltransferase related protein
MSGDFFKQVYRVTQTIPSGKVTTYGAIARVLGTRDARLVGFALHANRSDDVPCHRVVNREGKLAANYAFNGAVEQQRRLEAEGVTVIKGRVNLRQFEYTF